MSTVAAPHPSPARSALVLVAFLVIAAAVAALGSIATIAQVDGWYAEADKVAWTPPNTIFGPVWTVLYVLMSVAAWLVWRRADATDVRRPLALYVIQLVLNAVWTPVFFGLYPIIGAPALGISAGIILVLDVAVLLTALAFARVSRAAALLLVPYGAWAAYATTLNLGIAVLNS